MAAADGVRAPLLAFDDIGTGLPVVFLHAFPLHRGMWSAQLGALAARARCIAPDLRGFGATPPGGAHSIDAHADDVVMLLDALGIERAVVVGLSMGGYVALAMWRRHPSRVVAMLLADTKAGPDDAKGRARREELIALARAEGSGAVIDAMMPGMLGKSTRARHPDLEGSVRAMAASAPTEGVIAALAALRDRPDSTPALATITVPVTVVVGDEDVLTPPDVARVMAEGIPGAMLEVIGGAGHLTCLERPAAFSCVAGALLDRLEG